MSESSVLDTEPNTLNNSELLQRVRDTVSILRTVILDPSKLDSLYDTPQAKEHARKLIGLYRNAKVFGGNGTPELYYAYSAVIPAGGALEGSEAQLSISMPVAKGDYIIRGGDVKHEDGAADWYPTSLHLFLLRNNGKPLERQELMRRIFRGDIKPDDIESTMNGTHDEVSAQLEGKLPFTLYRKITVGKDLEGNSYEVWGEHVKSRY